ncbi:DUF5777 family beta-barrel protein [Neolewinella lacunae]|uniref:DUF5777 domain-containing protein n=1 Tax=Neolewinella lacunae TaxID=1517758 RepID=A0A923T9C8_9BACT|nr:DUF5777 family beta-barrel protein [Neolewinella lacunae]MBC6995379.1 hypothetical protein [Neolewinella lacunae]MDN3633091.1 DUF5777 family beta-barrel protein [Neolewinella lacunae]
MLYTFRLLAIVLLAAVPVALSAQADKFTTATFRGTRVINGHSVELLRQGEMEMIVNHRFGRFNEGFNELFGLDQANIRIGLDYGIRNALTVGAGRSSLGKEFDAFLKLRLLRQRLPGQGFVPFSLTFFASTAYNSSPVTDPTRPLVWQNRLAFTYQLYAARKFSDRLSVQLMPSVVHYNLVEARNQANDLIALGAAFRYQVSKNLALTGEYYQHLAGEVLVGATNPLSVGVDINTGSHVFQLHLTNSTAMIEKQFIGETNGNWLDGDIHLGFNMVRTFKLKGRRY